MAKDKNIISIDASEVTEFVGQLTRITNTIPAAIEAVRPEFGAYMEYSRYLEEGTKNKDGSTRMAARPHIRPAVLMGMGIIVKHLADEGLAITNKMLNSKTGMPKQEQIQAWRKVWLRVLNGPIAQNARLSARAQKVYQYGFHIRSIRGYARMRTTGEIAQQQQEASMARKRRARA